VNTASYQQPVQPIGGGGYFYWHLPPGAYGVAGIVFTIRSGDPNIPYRALYLSTRTIKFWADFVVPQDSRAVYIGDLAVVSEGQALGVNYGVADAMRHVLPLRSEGVVSSPKLQVEDAEADAVTRLRERYSTDGALLAVTKRLMRLETKR
jgi:hypothetical protein